MPPPKRDNLALFDETSSDESQNLGFQKKRSSQREKARDSPQKRKRHEEAASPGSLLSMFSPNEQLESVTKSQKRSAHRKRVNLLGLNQVRKKISQSSPKSKNTSKPTAAASRKSVAAIKRMPTGRNYRQEHEEEVDLEQSSSSEEQMSDQHKLAKRPHNQVRTSAMRKAAAKSMKRIQELHPTLVQKKRRSLLEHNGSSGLDSDSEFEEHRRKSNAKKKHKPTNPPYSQQFHDDGTGKKPLRSQTLNFAVNLMKTEAAQTTKSMSQSLRQQGLLDERRRLHVKAPKHSEAIVANVRQRLRTTKLPSRYTRTYDRELEDMPQVNEQRRKDIDKTGKLIEKLDREREKLEEEFEKECERQEQLQQTLELAKESGREEAHSLLAENASENDHLQKIGMKVPARKFRSAPKGTMLRLIQKMIVEEGL